MSSGSLGALVVKLTLDKSEYSAPLEKGTQEAQKFGEAATGSFNQATISAKQQAAALRMVPAQVTDIVTSLQGGQKPLTVFMQQGGQLKDMFGGVVPAAKAMGSYLAGTLPTLLHPITLLTLGMAGFGYAVYEAKEQVQKLNQARVRTGGMIGMTGNEITAVADEVGKLTGQYGVAREAAYALVSSGQVAGSQLKVMMEGATVGAKVTGIAVSELVESLIAVGKDPVEASVKLNEKTNFLTLATLEQADALQKVGDKQGAAKLIFEEFAAVQKARLPELRDELGTIARAWDAIKESISGAWAEMLKWGKADNWGTLKKAEEENLALMQASIESGRNSAANLDTVMAKSRENIAYYNAQIAKEKELATSKGATAEAEKKKVEGFKAFNDFVESSKAQTKDMAIKLLNEKYAAATAQFKGDAEKMNEAGAAYNRALEKINKRFDKKGGKSDSFDKAEWGFGREIAGIEFAIKNFERFDGKVQASKEAMAEFDVVSGKYSDEARKAAKLPVLTDEQKAGYIEQAKRLDEVHDKLRRQNIVMEFGKRIKDLIYDETKHRESMQFELDMLGKTEAEVVQLTEARRIDMRVQDEIKQMREKYGKDMGDNVQSRLDKALAEINAEAAIAKAQASALVQAKTVREQDPWAGLTDSVRRYGDEAAKVGKLTESAMTTSIKGMEDALVTFVTTGKADWKSLGNTIIAEIARIQIKAMLSGIFGAGSSSGLFGSILSLLGGGTSTSSVDVPTNADFSISALPSAKGNIFKGGNVVPFAKGAAFTNSIAKQPTLTPMALFGEAGPEAIMPLRRDSSGRLGVAATGSQAPQVTVSPTYSINIDSRTDRAEVMSLVDKAVRNGNAHLVDTLQRRGMIPS